MSQSAVSQTIRALELQSGVTLLHRSTRKLALTEAGERYYPHCKRMLEAARAAAGSLQQAHDAPTGELRVSAPVGFASHIAPALAPLLVSAPQLRLRLLVDDAMIDLIDARVDLAIRVGRLADSTWVARRLCEFETILCASPDYLAVHGTPKTPQDLSKHQWLALARESSDAGKSSKPVSMELDFTAADGRAQQIQVEARIASNNQVSLQQMCEHGLGIARLGRVDVYPWLQRGALVQTMHAWRLPSMPVWAVTPRRDAKEAKVRLALDYVQRYFMKLPGSGE
jgi:DNA-binding transcriptional LysR family regulator